MRHLSGRLQALTLSAALLFATSATVVLAQQVSTDYDHSANFSQFHTFSFGNIHASDQLYEQRIKDQISRDFTAHGWQAVPDGGDVTIVAAGGLHTQQEYSTFYNGMGGFGWRRGWGGGGFGDAYTTVDQIPVGTLVVDIYQTGSKQLLFRGTASDQLSNNSNKNTAKLDKAIDKLFNKFPPKS